MERWRLCTVAPIMCTYKWRMDTWYVSVLALQECDSLGKPATLHVSTWGLLQTLRNSHSFSVLRHTTFRLGAPKSLRRSPVWCVLLVCTLYRVWLHVSECYCLSAHQLGHLLAGKWQVRAGICQVSTTKAYGNKTGDEWISRSSYFSMPIYLAPFLPLLGPCVTQDSYCSDSLRPQPPLLCSAACRSLLTCYSLM